MLSGLSAAGLGVPDDILLVTFGDKRVVYVPEVPVTPLRRLIHAMAKRSIELLLERISNKPKSTGAARIEVRFEAELMARHSSRRRRTPSRAPQDTNQAKLRR